MVTQGYGYIQSYGRAYENENGLRNFDALWLLRFRSSLLNHFRFFSLCTYSHFNYTVNFDGATSRVLIRNDCSRLWRSRSRDEVPYRRQSESSRRRSNDSQWNMDPRRKGHCWRRPAYRNSKVIIILIALLRWNSLFCIYAHKTRWIRRT